MAAQRREAERQAREQARLAKERERAAQQRHIESQQRTAELRTSEVEQQARILDKVLTSVLPLPVLTFDSLKVTPELPGFEPGPLRVAESAPDWNDYAPPEPGGLSRVFGGAARHERQTAEARAGFDAAVADHRHREARRQRAFSAARTSYERKSKKSARGRRPRMP
jgi:restriction system protein